MAFLELVRCCFFEGRSGEVWGRVDRFLGEDVSSLSVWYEGEGYLDVFVVVGGVVVELGQQALFVILTLACELP